MKELFYMKKILTCALAGILLLACQPQSQTTPEYKTYTDTKINNVKVYVIWEKDPDRMCKILMGSHIYANSDFLGCSGFNNQTSTCTIILPKPDNFNDKNKLTILGHELMHCFGANHEG